MKGLVGEWKNPETKTITDSSLTGNKDKDGEF